MAISAYLHIDEKKFCIRDLDYQFDRDVGYSGLPNQRIRGGILQIVLEAPSRSDNIFSEWAISSDLMKNGEIWVYERDMQSLVRKIAFTDTLCVAYHERYRSSGKNPMLTSVIFAARLLNINGSEFRNDWPVLNDYEPASAHHPTTRTISVGTADKKPAEEKAPRPLVKSVAGPEEIKYKEKAIFEVCSYNTSNVTATDKSSVRWALKIDGKIEYLPDKGERLEYEVKDKKLEGKEITFMPYLSEPSESVCVKVAVYRFTPFLLDESETKPDINPPNGTAARHEDMRWGDYDKEQIKALGNLFKMDMLYIEKGMLTEKGLFEGVKFMAMSFSVGELEPNALAMVKKFQDNEGGTYSSSVLTRKVVEHASTQRFLRDLCKKLNSSLKKNENDIEVIRREDVPIGTDSYAKFNTYTDTFAGGLTIAINQVFAYKVELVEYEQVHGDYNGKFNITFYDHFGLDAPDVKDKVFKYHKGFRYWFILQHLLGYKPFVTKVEFEHSFTGKL